MKIALFIPNLDGGGAERVMVHLANGLANRGKKVYLVLAEAKGPNLSRVGDNINIVNLGKHRTTAALLPLVQFLRREKPTILISALEHANVMAIMAKIISRIPVYVITLVQAIFSHESRDSGGARNRALSAAIKRLYPHADAIIADSHGSAENIIRAARIPRRMVRVIYNPTIDPNALVLAKKPVDHPFFVKGAPPVILAAGRLIGLKDFPTLVRAFTIVRKQLPCRLIILSDGPDRGQLETLAVDLGIAQDVSMPGFVDNQYAYMLRSNVFVVSSKRESMSLVLVEALSFGLPVVATNCDYGPREILQNGKYGRLVPIGDVEKMADAIRMALMGSSPRIPSEILEPFTFDAALDRYENLFMNLSENTVNEGS